jgi:hypothetical protein
MRSNRIGLLFGVQLCKYFGVTFLFSSERPDSHTKYFVLARYCMRLTIRGGWGFAGSIADGLSMALRVSNEQGTSRKNQHGAPKQGQG